MPAAGKCRKGVFRMKKLLLVMLVPVLVLGVMSCGTKVQDGSPSPIGLQGKWETTLDKAVDLIISGNQVTLLSKSDDYLGNIALRTNYDGYKGLDDSGLFVGVDGSQTFKLEFYWFDEPYDQIGYINAKINTAEEFEVTEVHYNSYYQNIMLPPKDAKYNLVLPD
jgi:hypothetical protein